MRTCGVQRDGVLSGRGARDRGLWLFRAMLLALLLVTLLFPCPAFAEEFDSQATTTLFASADASWKYQIESDGTITIVENLDRGKVEEVNIPPHIDGYEVSGIATDVFAGDTFLKSVYFPATVVNLGEGAFAGCTGLKAAGLYAMEELAAVPDNCFKGCTALESVTIPASAKSVGVSAFEGCTALTSAEFQAPASVETIGEGAFRGCAALKSTEVPFNLKTIGQEAYAGCSSLTTIDCAYATKLQTIEARAFAGCSGITELFVPDWVSTLGDNAFADCTSLEVITFGDFPTHVGAAPFAGCSSLKTVAMVKLLEGWQWRTLDLPVPVSYFLTNFNWDVPGAPSKVIKIGQQGDKTSLVVPAYLGTHPIVSVEPDAAQGGCGLVSITFAEGSKVISIGDHAFQGCDQLTTVTIPASVNELGEGVFAGCSSLTDVTFETQELESLPTATFQNCDSLSTVRLPEGMTTLCTDSLSKCKSLSYVYLPDSLTKVEKNAFDASMTKKTVRMPDTEKALDLPDDRYLFPGFSMVTTSFEVSYGSWFESEWLQPHIDHKDVLEDARIYVPVSIDDGSVKVSVGICTYVAKEQTPPVTISRWHRTLGEGTEFSLVPAQGSDCVNVGSGKKAVLKGIDPRFSGSKEVEFSIQAASLDNVEMGDVGRCVWDDDDWQPEPSFTVVLAGETYTLQKQDYKPLDDSSYDNNTHAGEKTASITLSGAHNFLGDKTFYFSIEPRTLSDAKVVVESQTYTGSPIKPVPTSVQVTNRDGGELDLYYDTDYYVSSYDNNTAVGTASMTLSPKEGSSVCDSITVTFEIRKAGENEGEEEENKKDDDGRRKSRTDTETGDDAGSKRRTASRLPETGDSPASMCAAMICCATCALLSAALLRLRTR